MLLDVGRFVQNKVMRKFLAALFVFALPFAALSGTALSFRAQAGARPAAQQTSPAPTPAQPASAPTGSDAQTAGTPPRAGLHIVVVDPAHGGAGVCARGTGGIRGGDIGVAVAAEVRTAL